MAAHGDLASLTVLGPALVYLSFSRHGNWLGGIQHHLPAGSFGGYAPAFGLSRRTQHGDDHSSDTRHLCLMHGTRSLAAHRGIALSARDQLYSRHYLVPD